jgi:[ribosomal protein S5]-alanine N-acetyltransferase
MTTPIETSRLRLVPQTRDQLRAFIAGLQPQEMAEVSPAWLALLEGSAPIDPWIHGFTLVLSETGEVVGRCSFKGPPSADGMVEIAYGVNPEHQCKGYATEGAAALTLFASADTRVRVVRAHTFARGNASSRVLEKCGYRYIGEAIEPDDGLVQRWEKERAERGK